MPDQRRKLLCDEARLSVLVRAWQRAPEGLKEEWWKRFVNETADWLMAIIRSFKGDLCSLGSHDDIRAELVLHLHNRVLPAYRHGRGRLFSLITISAQNYIRTLLEKNQRLSRRYVAMGDTAQEIITAIDSEIYGLGAEIRARLDHFRAPADDFEGFLVRNLVVYSLWERGGRVSPSLEQIAGIVEEIVSLPAEVALEQTRTALGLLRKELADFRGRPSLYRGELAAERERESLPLGAEPNRDAIPALDFSWQ